MELRIQRFGFSNVIPCIVVLLTELPETLKDLMSN